MGDTMQRILRWFTRVNAFRIGLFTGLFFAVLHGWQIVNRSFEVPLLPRMESSLLDLRQV